MFPKNNISPINLILLINLYEIDLQKETRTKN